MSTVRSVVELVLMTTGAAVWVFWLALCVVGVYGLLSRFHREGLARVRRGRYDRQAQARRDAVDDELERMWDA